MSDKTNHCPECVRLAKRIAELEEAGEGLEALIKTAQGFCSAYLEPGDRLIQSERQFSNRIIGLFDGPIQRDLQERWRLARGEVNDG